jgi:uncharacterized protein YndB with AHSA1/START domain
MATVFLTPDQDTDVAEIEIATPPQRVLAALTDPEQNKKWGRSEAFQITLWEMDPRVGGAWRFASLESEHQQFFRSYREYVHHGEILEFDRPRVLAYSWFADWQEQPSRCTVVRWERTPVADEAKVKVTHSGLAEAKSRQDYYQGWPGVLALLKKFLEN